MTHYQTLGVKRTATAAEIKAAYRRLAKIAHPDVDKTPGAADRFIANQEAYEVLSDPVRRAAYDASLRAKRTGRAGSANASAGAPPRPGHPPSPPPAGASGGPQTPPPQGPASPVSPDWRLVIAAIGRVLWRRFRPYAVGGMIGGFLVAVAAVVILTAIMNAASQAKPSAEPQSGYPAVHVTLGPSEPPPALSAAPQPVHDPEPETEEQAAPPTEEPKSADPGPEDAGPAGDDSAIDKASAKEEASPAPLDLSGEWRGSFDQGGFTIPFTMALRQEGSRVTGRSEEFDGDAHREAFLTGIFLNGQLSLAKRYVGLPQGLSYTATEVSLDAMSGRWDGMGYAGDWRAERRDRALPPADAPGGLQ